MSAKKTGRELLAEKGLLKDVVALSIDGKIVDLHTPIDPASAYELVTTQDPRGLAVIRHSTAHVMADAVQRLFPGTKVTIGPAIDDGFYYDFKKPEGSFSEDDLSKIEKAMLEIIGKKSHFRRVPVSRDEALQKFRDMGESFKVEIIESIPAGEEISLYFHGEEGKEWVDVCEGPHVPNTGYLKAVKLTSVAGAYWRGDERNPMLQRIYGTAFPSKEALEEHLRLVEEAKARDHRKLGKELDLFMFDPVAPAMPFFLPKGAFVYNALVGYVRGLYDDEGYEEVITPQAFDPKLFRTSGHLGNYNENMFRLWTEDQLDEIAQAVKEKGSWDESLRDAAFALKPMNCPSHCVIFGSKKRSYRELPWRVADFGRLHRYERGGVVHGLSRVRTFCPRRRPRVLHAQTSAGRDREVHQVLERRLQGVRLREGRHQARDPPREAHRHRGRLGRGRGRARARLEERRSPLRGDARGGRVLRPEGGVSHQGRAQAELAARHDPVRPEPARALRAGYIGEDGKEHRPVMLHRAILGSLERFFSVYLEHSGGNFPAWIAPKQCIVLTVSEKTDDYARGRQGSASRASASTSTRARTSSAPRSATLACSRVPLHAAWSAPRKRRPTPVGVRSRDKGELGAMPLETFVGLLSGESKPPRG
jgi:threonyl-tRNA synthetase